MFSLFRHFPAIELRFSQSPIAIILSKTNQFKIYKMNLILGKFFICQDGWFSVQNAYTLSMYKSRVFLFSGHNLNSVPVDLLKELNVLKFNDFFEYQKIIKKINTNIENIKKQKEADQQKANQQNANQQNANQQNTNQENINQQNINQQKSDTKRAMPKIEQVKEEPIIMSESLFDKISSYIRVNSNDLRVGFQEIILKPSLIKNSRLVTAFFPFISSFSFVCFVCAIIFFYPEISSLFGESFNKISFNAGLTDELNSTRGVKFGS